MLYLINFTDYDNLESQTNFIIRSDKSEKEIEQIVDGILEESKRIWNEELEDENIGLEDIVLKKLIDVFGRDNVLDYTLIEFWW